MTGKIPLLLQILGLDEIDPVIAENIFNDYSISHKSQLLILNCHFIEGETPVH